jgi:hypothetical protein
MLRQFQLAIVTVLAMLIGIWIVGGSQSFKTCIHEHKNDNAYQGLKNEAITNRFFVRRHLQFDCAGEAIDKHNPVVTAIATVFIAFFTLTLWNATTEQGRLTNAILGHTVHTDITTQRAYLGRRSVDSVDFKIFLTDDGKKMLRLEITPTWENNGATPAINVKFCAFEPMICVSEPATNAVPIEIQMGELPRIAIGARQTMAGGSIAIKIEDLVKCSKRECKIFCIFRLEYNDVFIDTPIRIVQYCEELRYAGIGPITDIQPGSTNIPFVLYGYARFQIYS